MAKHALRAGSKGQVPSATTHLGHHQSRTAKRDRLGMVTLGMLTGPNTWKELFYEPIKHRPSINPRVR